MLKKVFLILLFWHIAAILQSCCEEDYWVEMQDFECALIDNSAIKPVLITEGRVNKKAFGIRVNMWDTVMYDHGIAQAFPVVQECRAVSCGENYVRVNNIDEISVRALNDYSSQFLASSDMTSLFRARVVEEGYEKTSYIPLSEIIPFMNASSSYTYAEQFDLYLMDTTCAGGFQQFEVAITMSDKRVISRQTDSVEFY